MASKAKVKVSDEKYKILRNLFKENVRENAICCIYENFVLAFTN